MPQLDLEPLDLDLEPLDEEAPPLRKDSGWVIETTADKVPRGPITLNGAPVPVDVRQPMNMEVPLLSPETARTALDTAVAMSGPMAIRLASTEVGQGASESAAQMAAGMTTPKAIMTAPLFAVPGVGEVLAAGMGAEAAGAGLGRTVAAIEQGNPRELGAGLVETAGGATMLVPAAVSGLRQMPTARAARELNSFPPLPDPDLVARNIASPGTRRASELEAVGLPRPEEPPFSIGELPFDAARRFGNFEVPAPDILPRMGRIDDINIVEELRPKEQLETRGKVSFGAEAPALLRTAQIDRVQLEAIEKSQAAGLTRTAQALEEAKAERTVKEQPATFPASDAVRDVTVKEAEFSAPPKETAVIDQVAAMTPDEFRAWAAQQKGGTTTTAYELGKTLNTPEGQARLRALEKAVEAEQSRALAAEDIQGSLDAQFKKQFFTEALESASGATLAKPKTTADVAATKAPEPAKPVMEAGAVENAARDAVINARRISDPEFRGANIHGKLIGTTKDGSKAVSVFELGGPTNRDIIFEETALVRPDGSVESTTVNKAAKPTEAGADIVTRLEQIRDRFDASGDMGKTMSLPHPDAFKAIGKSIIYTALDLAIGAVKAGRAIGDAVGMALDHIRKNHKGTFNEKEIRANLDYLIAQETKPKGAEPKPDVSGTTEQMRKSAERATRAEEIPSDVRAEIATAPESKYTQQSMDRVEDAVGSMTEAELSAVTKGSDIYTAAQLERANRLFKEGRDVEGYNVFAELEKEGTRLGQLINQFKLLKTSRPEDIVALVNRKLMAKGRDALTPAQAIRVKDAAAASKKLDRDLSRATEAWQKDPTDANATAAEAALDAANKSAVDLQQLVNKFEPKSTPQILKTVLQGNLLTPISEVANVFGNMSFAPFRAASRGVAAGLDMIDATIRNKPRESTVQPLAGTAEALKGAGRGFQQIPGILKEGSGSIKGEPGRGLHPIRAWIDQFAKNPDRPTTGGKLTMADRANMLIEGTLGVPAETMLRGLGAGDAPFRMAAQARVTAEQLKLKGVPRDQWAFAQKFPELFLDRATRDQIRKGTNEAIFQRESQTLNHITNWIRGKGDWFDLAMATVAPYKLTPWNIVGEILSYNPAVALGNAAHQLKKGNSRAAKMALGKFVTGSMLTGAGYWLYKNGLLAPSLDERDESQKARVLSNQVLPPNHINVSGLKRALEGGSPEFKPGDETVDIYRAGGLAGSIFYMVANTGRELERDPEATGTDLIGSVLRQSTLEQARFGLNQSYLSGVEGLLTAIKDGNPDNYIRQWLNTVSSIPIPNTLSALGRTAREYKPDFKADEFSSKVENLLKNKVGATGDLPLKRDFWGEPIRETPEGRNAIVYQLFDITKNRQVTSDPVALELYRLWRKTADSDVIPSLPKRSVTYGKESFEMTPEQYDRFAELVGRQRREIVDAVVINSNFYEKSDQDKITLLKRVYDRGMEKAKAMFREEFPDLRKAPAPAGFRALELEPLP